MRTIWTWILAHLYGWPKACSFIRAAMVTPLFVYRDGDQAYKQAKALKKSGRYNSVCSLVDLQSGRGYIFPGRGRTALKADARRNIQACLRAGVTPLIPIRNDWAVRTRTGSIPSVGGQPASFQDFYNQDALENECDFVDSFRDLWRYIHIQMSIETNHPASAAFALELGRYLRVKGFKGRLIVNAIDAAASAHAAIGPQLAAAGIENAPSWHASGPPSSRIWNTDGRRDISAGNARAIVNGIMASGREYIIWSAELADCPRGIPGGYL